MKQRQRKTSPVSRIKSLEASSLNLDELQSLIRRSEWFTRLGEPLAARGYVHLSNLNAWAEGLPENSDNELIASQMEWLPSARDQPDPFAVEGARLAETDSTLHAEVGRAVLDTYKLALASLRSFQSHPALIVGPHDFSEAARGAACYAARQAALEVLRNHPRTWCSIMRLYHAGHWPCGLIPDGRIVVL